MNQRLLMALLALTLMGCAAAQDSERAPQVEAKLKTACDAGKASACEDYRALLATCGTGSALDTPGLDEMEKCAAAVNAYDPTPKE